MRIASSASGQTLEKKAAKAAPMKPKRARSSSPSATESTTALAVPTAEGSATGTQRASICFGASRAAARAGRRSLADLLSAAAVAAAHTAQMAPSSPSPQVRGSRSPVRASITHAAASSPCRVVTPCCGELEGSAPAATQNHETLCGGSNEEQLAKPKGPEQSSVWPWPSTAQDLEGLKLPETAVASSALHEVMEAARKQLQQWESFKEQLGVNLVLTEEAGQGGLHLRSKLQAIPGAPESLEQGAEGGGMLRAAISLEDGIATGSTVSEVESSIHASETVQLNEHYSDSQDAQPSPEERLRALQDGSDQSCQKLQVAEQSDRLRSPTSPTGCLSSPPRLSSPSKSRNSCANAGNSKGQCISYPCEQQLSRVEVSEAPTEESTVSGTSAEKSSSGQVYAASSNLRLQLHQAVRSQRCTQPKVATAMSATKAAAPAVPATTFFTNPAASAATSATDMAAPASTFFTNPAASADSSATDMAALASILFTSAAVPAATSAIDASSSAATLIANKADFPTTFFADAASAATDTTASTTTFFTNPSASAATSAGNMAAAASMLVTSAAVPAVTSATYASASAATLITNPAHSADTLFTDAAATAATQVTHPAASEATSATDAAASASVPVTNPADSAAVSVTDAAASAATLIPNPTDLVATSVIDATAPAATSSRNAAASAARNAAAPAAVISAKKATASAATSATSTAAKPTKPVSNTTRKTDSTQAATNSKHHDRRMQSNSKESAAATTPSRRVKRSVVGAQAGGGRSCSPKGNTKTGASSSLNGQDATRRPSPERPGTRSSPSPPKQRPAAQQKQLKEPRASNSQPTTSKAISSKGNEQPPSRRRNSKDNQPNIQLKFASRPKPLRVST
eukprot:TRINITY_DN4319_c0_g1_i2.p1 TRINITY_DN4319_c0_g1~~TRINITY_DN4319_c0_g1_i2.p1  ORF type:complete len:875 (+),score=206.47 TRINITY_DN4319_c0_g1_i2:25-2625(+)